MSVVLPPVPQPDPPRRHRKALLVPVALTALLAVAVAVAGPVVTTTDSSTPAQPVSAQSASGDTIAKQNDPAIVDVTTEVAFGRGESAGSGIVLTSDGEVVTNNHVIEGATSIEVRISDDSASYKAKVLGTSETADIALLKLQNAHGLKTVHVGSAVVAIGNAFNRPGNPAVTEGNVTGLNRAISIERGSRGVERLRNLIEMDTQIVPGNSGGPLFDDSGDVVGINVAATVDRFPRGGSSDSFAIPIDAAMAVVHQIEAGHGGNGVQIGTRGFLGIEVRDSQQGVEVLNVASGSGADDAGIAEGDTIVAANGKNVSSAQQLTDALSGTHPGNTVRVTWEDSNGRQHSAQVHLGSGPAA